MEVTDPLGFENTFAMVIRGDEAKKLNVHTLSEAVRYSPQWRLGVGYEFEERPDGLRGSRQHMDSSSTRRREPWISGCFIVR